jgi:hypothetical protein
MIPPKQMFHKPRRNHGRGLFPFVSRLDAFECGFDGLRVDMPHEGSDVLNLPAPGARAPYFTCEFDGRHKLFRQLHGLKLAEWQGDQLFAQALLGPGFIFFPGSCFYNPYPFCRLCPSDFSASIPVNFFSVGAFAFFPPKSGFPHNSVDFTPELLHYLTRCGKGRVHSGR